MATYEENPHGVTKADIVVAIPSLNEAKSIGHTAGQIDKGLAQHFGHLKSVIINCDNHSTDGTKEAFFKAPGAVPKIYLSTPPGTQGKGNALKLLFEKVREMEAAAVVVVEADIKNISPYWVRNFVEPLLKGAGYVIPLYVRHKYEATMTSSVVYPFMRCLYGRRVRQPNVGDFGFKGHMVEHFLNCPTWNESVEHFGIDVWMTTIALNARVPVCQSFIGAPKVHEIKDPDGQLAIAFHQVVGTMFDLMPIYAGFWRQVKWSKPASLFGTDIQELETPVPAEINSALLHERFLEGFDRYYGVWNEVYDQTICHKLQEIRSLGLQHFSLPTQTWARILFDASAAYHRMSALDKRELLDSLLPLYLGKVLSFVKKTERMSIQQAEEYIENECMIFEENKPYLVKLWE